MKENRVYTNSKDDVADAVRDFKVGEKVDFLDEDEGWESYYLVNIHPFKNYPYACEDDVFHTIRKLQKPVNPYEALEENGKYKVVEVDHISDAGFLNVRHNNIDLVLNEWVAHKDFAGYVFDVDGVMVVYADCWDANLGHAIGVLFKVGE